MIRKIFAWLLVAGLTGAAVQAQTADEIVAKNIQARGGTDKLKGVQSERFTGKVVLDQGVEAPFTREVMRPNKMRMEFTVQGMTGVQAYDGKSGWAVMPFIGQKDPEAMTGAIAAAFAWSSGESVGAADADIDGPLVDYKDKGNQVELVGKVDVEGTPAYKLKVTKKNGDVINLYLDAGSYLEIKAEGKAKVRGQEIEGETVFGDYKTVDGLTFPFSMKQRAKGMPGGMEITVSKVEINPKLEESRFAMPAAEKKESPAPPQQ